MAARLWPQPQHPRFDERKFRELLLYVAEQTRDDRDFGDVKLNKALAFSDFLAYACLGAPITGAEYQRQRMGPVARKLLPIRHAMEAEGLVDVERSTVKYVPTRCKARRPADISVFSKEELEIVDDIIDLLRPHTAARVSELSHRVVGGWEVAATGETIPYETFLVETKAPRAETLEQARGIAAAHGWAR